MRYTFDDFTFDVSTQELRRGSELVHLTPKAMQLLQLLVETRESVARREDLVDELWPDVVVSEASLKNLVALLRSTLGDHGRDGRLIQTVHGRGYRFVGSVRETGDPGPARNAARLYFGEQWFTIHEGGNIVGREADCDVILDHASVSRHHARISLLPDGLLLEDLDSKNGTFVRGQRITGTVTLDATTAITFGRVMTRLVIEGRSPSTASISYPD